MPFSKGTGYYWLLTMIFVTEDADILRLIYSNDSWKADDTSTCLESPLIISVKYKNKARFVVFWAADVENLLNNVHVKSSFLYTKSYHLPRERIFYVLIDIICLFVCLIIYLSVLPKTSVLCCIKVTGSFLISVGNLSVLCLRTVWVFCEGILLGCWCVLHKILVHLANHAKEKPTKQNKIKKNLLIHLGCCLFLSRDEREVSK